MALTLDGISIQGFRSYVNDQAFHFPADPGLYMFSGAVGVGKSTIFGAVRWVLTGALSSGLRAKQVASWRGDEQMAVVLDLRVGGRLRCVTRRHAPNSLTLQVGLDEPKVVEQPEIDRVFGTTAAHAMDAVYIAQRGESFMDIGSAQQAARVSEALGLERWDERTARAKAAASKAEADLREAERTVAGAEGGLAATETSLRQLLAMSKAFERDAEARKLKTQRRLWVASYRDQETDARHDRRPLFDRQQTATQSVLDAEAAARRLEPGKTCPTCGGPLAKAVRERAVCRYSEAQRVTTTKREAVETIQAQLDVASERYAKAVDRQREATAYALQGCANNPEFDAEIAAIPVELESENPHRRAIQQSAEARKRLKAKIAAGKEAKARAEQAIALAQLGAKTFPRVKLTILARACAQLTTLTNNSLGPLGLPGWSVRWSPVKELDSGDTRAKFTMVVRSPESPEWVDWRAWSGGQSTQLRIAGAAAYMDLVRSRLKHPPSFEFWDEAGQYLGDADGLAMMSFFRHRAHSQGRQVWLVDHNTQFAGEVDKHWVVTRDHMGSHINPG